MRGPSDVRGLSRQLTRIVLIGTFLASLAVTAPVQADTVVERRLAALEPCSDLKQDVYGATLAINKLESIALPHIQVDMTSDQVTLSLQGRLSCETSDSALFPGNASVAVNAQAYVRLADCAITSLIITPTAFGGTYSSVVQAAWGPLIQPKIETEARRMLSQACEAFITSP